MWTRPTFSHGPRQRSPEHSPADSAGGGAPLQTPSPQSSCPGRWGGPGRGRDSQAASGWARPRRDPAPPRPLPSLQPRPSPTPPLLHPDPLLQPRPSLQPGTPHLLWPWSPPHRGKPQRRRPADLPQVGRGGKAERHGGPASPCQGRSAAPDDLALRLGWSGNRRAVCIATPRPERPPPGPQGAPAAAHPWQGEGRRPAMSPHPVPPWEAMGVLTPLSRPCHHGERQARTGSLRSPPCEPSWDPR